jgi:hypothetical protein
MFQQMHRNPGTLWPYLLYLRLASIGVVNALNGQHRAVDAGAVVPNVKVLEGRA